MQRPFKFLVCLILLVSQIHAEEKTEPNTNHVFITFHTVTIPQKALRKISEMQMAPLEFEQKLLSLWKSGEGTEVYKMDLRGSNGGQSIIAFNHLNEDEESTTPLSLSVVPTSEDGSDQIDLQIHLTQNAGNKKTSSFGRTSSKSHPLVELTTQLSVSNGTTTLLGSIPTLKGKDQLFAFITARMISETTTTE